MKKTESQTDPNWPFTGTVALWLIILYIRKFLAFVTKYYPFSLFFTDRGFHARWVGAQKVISLVGLGSCCYNNSFYAEIVDRDRYCYQIIGRFKRKPNAKIFEGLQRIAEDKGLDIKYLGEVTEGKHKFVAPVDQNWQVIGY